MKRILVIDDDPDIVELLRFNLTRAGFEAISAQDGVAGLDLARNSNPDLIVLDIMLPEASGLDILKTLRFEPDSRPVPIIMLTAKGAEVDRVLGLELGADDYLAKPFSVRELLLRIEKILTRRESGQPGESEAQRRLRCNQIMLDSDRYEVRVKGDRVRLTMTEFNLLEYMLRNQGRALSRDRLLQRVWGYHYMGTTRTVDTHVQRLRDKLGPEGHLIRTIRGIGYKLEPEDVART